MADGLALAAAASGASHVFSRTVANHPFTVTSGRRRATGTATPASSSVWMAGAPASWA